MMNKAFEKILDRLEEERELSYADFSRYVDEVSPCLDAEYDDFFHRGLERASRLVKEAAEEYNNGWIPCSDRLPDKAGYEVLATLENGYGQRRVTIIFTGYGDSQWHCNHKEFDLDVWKVIAWQPLPEPHKENKKRIGRCLSLGGENESKRVLGAD